MKPLATRWKSAVPRRWRDYQFNAQRLAGLDLASERRLGASVRWGLASIGNHPEATVEIEGGVTAIVHDLRQ